jgi:oligopeptide/dipeptide ABC transporter ATP-binding protein
MDLLPPNAELLDGRVECDGLVLTSLHDKGWRKVRGRQIGIVFQDSMTSLNPVLTVGKQISEVLCRHRGLNHRQAAEHAIELLEKLEVTDARRRMGQFPHELSGGLRQRVAMAIALAPDPAVLIADEPTTALDVTIQAQLLGLLRNEQAARKMAILLITHDLAIIAGNADEVAVMYAGRLVEEGPTDEIFAHPRHPYTSALMQAIPRLDRERSNRLWAIPGSPPALETTVGGCRFRERCAIAIERCGAEPPLTPVGESHQAVACWVRGSQASDDVEREAEEQRKCP